MPQHRTKQTKHGATFAFCRAFLFNARSRFVFKLEAAVQELSQDESVRAVVVSSEVPGVFCAGADLKERATMSQTEAELFVERLRALMTKIATVPVPTIAAVEGGPTVGRGMRLCVRGGGGKWEGGEGEHSASTGERFPRQSGLNTRLELKRVSSFQKMLTRGIVYPGRLLSLGCAPSVARMGDFWDTGFPRPSLSNRERHLIHSRFTFPYCSAFRSGHTLRVDTPEALLAPPTNRPRVPWG